MKFVPTLATLAVAAAFGACSNMPTAAPVATIAQPTAARATLPTATTPVAAAPQALNNRTAKALPGTVITATKSADGNVFIGWSDNLSVTAAEHYVGHGTKGGLIKVIKVAPGTKLLALSDVSRNGGRLGLVTANGYFHVECGGNSSVIEATLVGLHKDCSHVDPATGQLVGALVID